MAVAANYTHIAYKSDGPLTEAREGVTEEIKMVLVCTITLNKHQNSNKDVTTVCSSKVYDPYGRMMPREFWLEILLCMIGEGFNEYSDICGAVVNVRARSDKISVWTGDAGTQASVMEIGRKLKERLRITPKMVIGYQVHRDTMVKDDQEYLCDLCESATTIALYSTIYSLRRIIIRSKY